MTEEELMINDCIQRQSQLSDWEVNFIDSIDKRIGDGQGLTDGQREKLNEIWDRVT